MNLKKIGIILFAAGLILTATGCVDREIVINRERNTNPDIIVKENIEIDWNQVMNDCEELLNSDDYPYGSYLDFVVHDDENFTEIIWPLKKDCPLEEMPRYAEAYAKAFNDAVATQDFKYEPSSETSYGGYWDKHDMGVQVYYEDDILNVEKYSIDQLVPAGSNDEIILNPNISN